MQDKFNNISELEVLLEKTDKARVEDSFRGGEVIGVSEYKFIVNDTKNFVETVVPANKAKVINHSIIFQPFINSLKETNNIQISGFVENNGGRVIVRTVFDNLSISPNNDNIKLGIILENSYSRLNFSAQGYAVRSVCQNGMLLGNTLAGKISLSHNNNIAELSKDLSRLIGNLFQKSKMIENIIVEAQKDVLTSETELKQILVGEDVCRPKSAEKYIKLIEDMNNLTRYSLYNAITQMATHMTESLGKQTYLQKIAQRILVTKSENLVRGNLKRDEEDL